MEFPIEPTRYITFLGIMAALAFTPGPANIFAIATGMAKGKRAALWGVIGLNLGTSVWFVAAALGLGTMITAFPNMFHVLTYAGAVYVVYLAVQSLRQAFSKSMAPLHKLKPTARAPLWDGFLVQVANPKAVLFFTAIMPPFLDVTRPLLPQLLLVAFGTFGFDFLAMSLYGLGGATLAKRAEDPRFRRGFALAVGLLLLLCAALIFANG